MTITIRPAVRKDTPLILGLAGPSKSGKTYSALRLAGGLTKKNGGRIVMLNAEGARGHQYADRFSYDACDIAAPYSYTRYSEYLDEIAKTKPACVIIDSISHAHDGPGGMIEEHDNEVDRRAGDDYKKRDKVTWAAWIKPKAAEGKFIYRMLSLACPVILCFRAKEKLKIVPGADPVDLGYQPIASERIAFETIFSLMLPPRSKGVPDLALSDMREPFDTMIKRGRALDEELGEELAAWAAGSVVSEPSRPAPGPTPPEGEGAAGAAKIDEHQKLDLTRYLRQTGVSEAGLLKAANIDRLEDMPADFYDRAMSWIGRAHEKRPASP